MTTVPHCCRKEKHLARMNIIHEKWRFLNSTIGHVPTQARQLYSFGLATLSARPIQSLRANARLLPLNWYTAKSKACRLVKNAKLELAFPRILLALALVLPGATVSVDFSDFGNGFQVLLFAKQTRKGRALPLYFEILRYPIQKDSQNTFVIAAIRNFAEILGFKPRLVFDRGFAAPAIIRFLEKNQYSFLIRIKGGKHIEARNGRVVAARSLRRKDAIIRAYGLTLRLVASDTPENGNDPWYLMTNDFSSDREAIVAWYYHRFEIEELFRDAKRLLGLEGVRCKTERSLAVVLWFAILGIWCLAYLMKLLDARARNHRLTLGLSETRFLFEKIQAACVRAAEGRYFHASPV